MSKTYLQEKITGTNGQVVMINSSGTAEAQTKDFAPAYTSGTADLVAGSSALATGLLYLVYE